MNSIQPFWRFFEEVSSIPRASEHEGAVLAYVKRFADDRDLSWREDSAGNIVVERGGANGGEDAETVVIQGAGGEAVLCLFFTGYSCLVERQ